MCVFKFYTDRSQGRRILLVSALSFQTRQRFIQSFPYAETELSTKTIGGKVTEIVGKKKGDMIKDGIEG